MNSFTLTNQIHRKNSPRVDAKHFEHYEVRRDNRIVARAMSWPSAVNIFKEHAKIQQGTLDLIGFAESES